MVDAFKCPDGCTTSAPAWKLIVLVHGTNFGLSSNDGQFCPFCGCRVWWTEVDYSTAVCNPSYHRMARDHLVQCNGYTASMLAGKSLYFGRSEQ